MQLYEFKETQERVILIGVQTGVGDDVEASLDELDELAQTAGAETVAKVIQNREAVHPGTYIGKGKIEEVASLLRALDANGVICDDELSPSQLNNLERELDKQAMRNGEGGNRNLEGDDGFHQREGQNTLCTEPILL